MRPFLRYLRLAFSATCLIACVLLIVLWVRSYLWGDALDYKKSRLASVYSNYGHIQIQWLNIDSGVMSTTSHGWKYRTIPVVQSWSFGWFSMKGTRMAGVAEVFAADVVVIRVPTCLLINPFAAIGLLPWIRKPKWRFSLRTLLISITLLAVVLGLIVWQVRR